MSILILNMKNEFQQYITQNLDSVVQMTLELFNMFREMTGGNTSVDCVV